MNDISLAEIFQIKQPYSDQPISISGPSAVGKSTVGKKVANNLHIPFYDLDDEVSQIAGYKTTQEVIQTLGHDKFKIIQHQCLQQIAQSISGRYVLASGGEIVRFGYDQQIIDANRIIINESTYNICLFPSKNIDESVDILFPRLDDGKRDVQTTGKTTTEFRVYIDVFSQYVDLADAIILTHRASINDITNAILDVI
jgi:shikimate kinase